MGKKNQLSVLAVLYLSWQLASHRMMSDKKQEVSLDRRLTPVSSAFVSVVMSFESVFVDEIAPRERAEGKQVLGARLWSHHKTFKTFEPSYRHTEGFGKLMSFRLYVADAKAQRPGWQAIFGDGRGRTMFEDRAPFSGSVRVNCSLSFHMVTAEESFLSLSVGQGLALLYCLWEWHQAKHLSFQSTFPLIYKKEEKKQPYCSEGVSLSWVTYNHLYGLCVGDGRADPAWLSLPLQQPSVPRLVLHPFYQSCDVPSKSQINMPRLFAFSLCQFSDRLACSPCSSCRCTTSRVQSWCKKRTRSTHLGR